MVEQTWLAERFEEQRAHLRAVAYRMLGSTSEADDAVQESWLRLSRAGADGIDNLRGWLTTVVGRVCLDMLRARAARREEPMDEAGTKTAAGGDRIIDPEHEAALADSVGMAMLVVLETLSPPERIAFVLHDTFAVPFEEIAPIVGRSPAATRQLASRARRRVRGASPENAADISRKRQVVAAFLAASREGRFDALLALLDPDAVLRADRVAVEMSAARLAQGAPPLAAEIRGARSVAETFFGRSRAARLALIDGAPGAVWSVGGRPHAVFRFAVDGETVSGIDVVADEAAIAGMAVEVVE